MPSAPASSMTCRCAFSKVRMNFSPMILRFALRLGDALQRLQEVVGRIHGDELDTGGGHEVVLDLLDLTLTQQTVIHEHAGELVADGLVHQGGGHGGVYTAGQAADHLGVAHLGADLGHLVLDDAGGVPIRAKAGALMQEGLDELLPHRRVLDLRMPLHTVQLARGILHGGHRRALGVRKHLEALGCGLHGHAMAHPHALIRRGAVQQTLGLVDHRGGSCRTRPTRPCPPCRPIHRP